MNASQSISIRNRIVGILVKRARLEAGRSQRECADFLGCSPFMFTQCEQGRRGLSLPQLEALTHLLNVPLESLWNEAYASPTKEEPTELPIEQLMMLRRKEMAIKFRQCRQGAGLTQEQIGQIVGRSAYIVSQYEHGRRDIPLAELEATLALCNQTLADFLTEETIPLVQADQERQALTRLNELPPDIRSFVLMPTNELYLRVAILLSALKTDSLRQIAGTILDITY